MLSQSCILLFFFALSQQCDLSDEKNIQIISEGTVITIEQNETEILVYYMSKERFSIFSAPNDANDAELVLSYENGFQINFRNVTLVAGDGNVTLSPILQNFLKPMNRSELLQLCLDFSLERLILKIFVGLLSLLVILSNGQLTMNTIKTLLSSLKSQRGLKTRRPRSRSQESFTTRYRESTI